MVEAIPAELVTGSGIAGIGVLTVWLLLTGKLITRAAHEDRIRDKDDQIAYLRASLDAREREATIRTEQVQHLLANSDLTVQLLQSISRETRDGDLAT